MPTFLSRIHLPRRIVRSSVLVLAMTIGTRAGAETTATGKIIQTEGHLSPACRTVWLKQADGSVLPFRMSNTGVEDGIMAVTLTALTTGLNVVIHYTPGAGSGCGTEPAIAYIDIKAAGN
jgi:hypothetical protein